MKQFVIKSLSIIFLSKLLLSILIGVIYTCKSIFNTKFEFKICIQSLFGTYKYNLSYLFFKTIHKIVITYTCLESFFK